MSESADSGCTFAPDTIGSPVISEQVVRVRSPYDEVLHVSPRQIFTGTEYIDSSQVNRKRHTHTHDQFQVLNIKLHF